MICVISAHRALHSIRRPRRSFSAICAKCILLSHFSFVICHLAQRREAPYCKLEIAK